MAGPIRPKVSRTPLGLLLGSRRWEGGGGNGAPPPRPVPTLFPLPVDGRRGVLSKTSGLPLLPPVGFTPSTSWAPLSNSSGGAASPPALAPRGASRWAPPPGLPLLLVHPDIWHRGPAALHRRAPLQPIQPPAIPRGVLLGGARGAATSGRPRAERASLGEASPFFLCMIHCFEMGLAWGSAVWAALPRRARPSQKAFTPLCSPQAAACFVPQLALTRFFPATGSAFLG